ncbi:MAG: hypothetical protein V4693_18785 [Pseudomonadota bacterium]
MGAETELMIAARFLALALAASCVVCPAAAQAAAQVAARAALPKVEMRWKKNPGHFRYREACRLQQRVLSILPFEPRLIDFRIRVSMFPKSRAAPSSLLRQTWRT